MIIEQVHIGARVRTRTVQLVVLSLSLSGCASSGAPAPVEQRQAANGGARIVLPAASAGAPDARRDSSSSTVQVVGLGDDPVHTAPAAAWTSDRQDGGAEPVGDAAAVPQQAAQVPGRSEPDADFAVANPAVVALLNRANRDAAAGRQGASAASLERAIKIEPGNAWLWHRLAQTRLTQNQPGEAAALAARSNSLAGSDNALRARNWRLIASVHELRGETVAAQAARRKAEGLERGTS